jgi:hypothetical protein
MIVTGDEDLRILHPWRGIDMLPPMDHLKKTDSTLSEILREEEFLGS